MEMNTGFLGRDGFIWALGVVEDRYDPEKLGRVKVRFLGYHTKEQAKINTADLPWSQVMTPVGSSFSGIGESHQSLKEGTWVVGFAKDPENLQEWIIMGTLPGLNTTPSFLSPSVWGLTRGGSLESDTNTFTPPDYGFFDVTPVGKWNFQPWEPDETTWRSGASGTITPFVDMQSYHAHYGYGDDRGKMFGDEILYGEIYTTSEHNEAALGLPKGSAKSLKNITHTDALYEAYGTTRRIVGPPKDAQRFWEKTGLDSEFSENTNMGQVISTGYYNSSDITYPIVSDMEAKNRMLYPRMRYCKVKDIETLHGPSMLAKIKQLYTDQIYGTIKFDDLKDDDYVAIPTSDTNRLAKGGLRIINITVASNKIKIETSNVFGELSHEPFAKDDIIMLSGIKGMQELNGRMFKAIDWQQVTVTADDSGGPNSKKAGYIFYLGSSDGTVIGGPGDNHVKTYSSNNTINPMADGGTYDAEGNTTKWEYAAAQTFSTYLGGGVVVLDPHYSIRNRAESREKWINIGVGRYVPDATATPPGPGKDAANFGLKTRETMTHYWSEPTSAYAAQYPYNHVYESESGHIMEYDDTPGAERIHQSHRSGSYYEIDPSGSKTTKVTGDNHNLVIHDDYLYVKGKVFWTGDDEMMIRCNDQLTIGAKWNIRLVSDHNIDIHAKGDLNLRGHNVNIEAEENSINMQAANITAVARGFTADDAADDLAVPRGGTIFLEAKGQAVGEDDEEGSSGGAITLKVPEGDPLMTEGLEDIANSVSNANDLAGGLIKFEGGSSINATNYPRVRNDLQARVHFAHWSNAAYQSTFATSSKLLDGGLGVGGNPNQDSGIGHWGNLGDPDELFQSTGGMGEAIDFWSTPKDTFELARPQTDVFAGSTSPAINQNAEKVRTLIKKVEED